MNVRSSYSSSNSILLLGRVYMVMSHACNARREGAVHTKTEEKE